MSSTAEQEKRMSPISMPACSAALSCRTFSTIAIVASGPQVKVIPMLWAGRSTSRYMSSRPAVRMTVALRFRLGLIPPTRRRRPRRRNPRRRNPLADVGGSGEDEAGNIGRDEKRRAADRKRRIAREPAGGPETTTSPDVRGGRERKNRRRRER